MKYFCVAFLIGAASSYGMELGQELAVLTSWQHEQKAQDTSGQPHTFLISPLEVNLERQSAAKHMSWLPALYDASGLASCMNKECFMVSALAKIKEAITHEDNRMQGLEIGACLAGEPLPEYESNKHQGLFTGNVLISGAAFLGTFMYWMINLDSAGNNIEVSYPQPIDIKPVQTSCDRLYQHLHKNWGMDWAHECIMKSFELNVPCNATALGEYTYGCCWAKIDPVCNEQIVSYMTSTYPPLLAQARALHDDLYNKAQRAIAMPFYITAPTVVALNLLFQLARYKYRRIMCEKNATSVQLQVDVETVSLDAINQE